MENQTPTEQQPTQSKWYDKTWLVILLCIFFFPVGLYGLWKSPTIQKGLKIGITVVIGLIVLVQITEDKNKNSTSSSSNSASNAEPNAEAQETPKAVGVGEVLHTQYFDIIVNKATVTESVNTGNEFADLKAEAGNQYIVINASFKNTDNESRMLMDGSVWINYNGKDYEFDNAETVMLEGWGLILDQINPLITKTTKLVYKIPKEIKGDVYWQPGRADSDQRIFLGNIK